MSVEVQLWVTDLSTDQPQVTHCYTYVVDAMPREDLTMALPAGLQQRVRVHSVNVDSSDDLFWVHAEAPSWTIQDERLLVAAGCEENGIVEGWDDGTGPYGPDERPPRGGHRGEVEQYAGCPQCGAVGLPILYGYPEAETLEEVGAGKAVLGGCAVADGLPTHTCRACTVSWGALEMPTGDPPERGFWDDLEADEDEDPATVESGRTDVERYWYDKGCLAGEASQRVGVPAWRLKQWRRRSQAGDARFDAAAPSQSIYAGTLKIYVYTEQDLMRLAAFSEPEGVNIMDDELRLVGWRYEWDHRTDRYVTTDYLTTDADYSYAVTRVDWLGRSGRGYKVWGTASGETQAMFPTWSEARRHALHLASGGRFQSEAAGGEAEVGAGPDEPADMVERLVLPTDG